MERLNYIYVDFENVQTLDLDLISDRPVAVVLLLGKQNKDLPVSLVKKLLERSGQVRIVQTEKTGKNALDFVLAYQIGLKAALEPNSFFHIISRDRGFDALVAHLKAQKILAARHDAFSSIPILIPVERLNPNELAVLVRERLAKASSSRPRKRKTLQNHINGQFGKRLSPDTVEKILTYLASFKTIEISPDELVSYAFDHPA
jgi:hypothetical protein